MVFKLLHLRGMFFCSSLCVFVGLCEGHVLCLCVFIACLA